MPVLTRCHDLEHPRPRTSGVIPEHWPSRASRHSIASAYGCSGWTSCADHDLVEALVRGDFDSLEADGRAGRVGADGLRRSITEYGRTLVVLPDEAFDLVEAGMVTARPGEWWIVVPMWTAEEGQSDLSLELAALPTEDGHLLEVADLHVL